MLCPLSVLVQHPSGDDDEGFQGGLQIGGRMITNLRYANDVILLATSEVEIIDLVRYTLHYSLSYLLER